MVRIFNGLEQWNCQQSPGQQPPSQQPLPQDPPDSGKPPREGFLIEPFCWIFQRFRPALVSLSLFMPLLWISTVVLRQLWGMERVIFWEDELTVVAAFTGAGVFALFLAKLFFNLQTELTAVKPQVAPLLAKQHISLHNRSTVIWFPLGLAALAIGIRYISGSDFNPFGNWTVDFLFSAFLFLGFFFILNTTALCARYTEIARTLGHEVAEGRLGRQEMRTLSAFYLKVAVIASFHFALCAMTVYALYLIYTYSGNMWQGYKLIRLTPGLKMSEQISRAWNDPLFNEIAIFFGLYGSVSLAPLVYFIVPQWEVHRILVRRKEGLLKTGRKMVGEAENRLGPNASEADLENYAHCLSTLESVEKMGEWPFELGGKMGAFLLIAIPSFIVLIKEVVVGAFVNIYFK